MMQKVLVIDDDKITHSFIKRALKQQYTLIHAYDGEQGIKSCLDLNPDMILLDVEMPGKNGYEVCEILKSNENTQNIPVIFLSGNSSINNIMLGFEAGADDYIVKPFQAQALLAKLLVIGRYKTHQTALHQQIEAAHKTAHTAISGTGDLGQALHFIELCYNVSSIDEIAQALFRVTNNLQLKCALIIQSFEYDNFYSSEKSEVPPLEQELLQLLKNENRFYDFGCRTQINYSNISLLIKNMPLDNMERYGQIKDILPTMLAAADSKINQLNTLHVIDKNTKNINQSFSMISSALNVIKKSINSSHNGNTKIMRGMLTDLDRYLPTMGLESDQEQYILDRVDEAITESHKTISKTHQVTENFNAILENLSCLVGKQQDIQNEISKLSNKTDYSNDDGYAMDVELF